MSTRYNKNALLLVLVTAGITGIALAQEIAPLGSGPALKSSADLSADLKPAASAATRRDQIIQLLRYSSATLLKQDSIAPTDWTNLVQDQAMIKDVDGVNKSAGLIDTYMAKEKDADKKDDDAAEVYPALAGAFGRIGNKEKALAYVAKVPKTGPEPEVIAQMWAEIGDLGKVDDVINDMPEKDRELAYGDVAEKIWLGDQATGEKLLQKLNKRDGTPQNFVAAHLAGAGEIARATKMADTLNDAYYWKCIVTAQEEAQDYAGAKATKARYLKCIAGKPEAEQRNRLFTTFTYQMQLEPVDASIATAKRMVRKAQDMMAANDSDWHVGAGEAAMAASQLGDDAMLTAIQDSAAKMDDVDKWKLYMSQATDDGRARRLIAQGKLDEAIKLAASIKLLKNGWGSWKAKEAIYHYVMQKGDVTSGIRIEARTGTTDMTTWLSRALVRMQLAGEKINGKPADVFDWINNVPDPFDRSEAARGAAEALMREKK